MVKKFPSSVPRPLTAAEVIERERVIEEGQALALEFEKKSANAKFFPARWWFRRAAKSIRKDLGELYRG